MSFPTIKTNRLLLRAFVPEDITNVYYGLSHPQVIPFYGVSFDSLEATREQMEWFADLEKTGKGIWWAICSADNQTFFGAGGFNDLNREHRKAEVGLWLLPEYWGQGIMQEAMPLMLDHAFEELDLHRIEGFVESENHNCKRALAKLNFNYEGTMKDCEVKNGQFISLDIYSKISPL